MTWRTHVLAGIGALWAINIVPGGITADNLGALCLFASFGALLPDLDASQSKIRSLSLARIQPFEPIGFAAHRFFGHRGLLHSLAGLATAGIIAGAAASRIGWEPALALFLGYGSHLALDACTKSGIPLFPGRAWRLHLLPKSLRIATGSAAEDLVLVTLLIAVLALMLPYLVSYHS